MAPFDARYSGFGTGVGPFGVVLIDEGCWSRAMRETKGHIAETIASAPAVDGLRNRKPDQAAAKMADLVVLRAKAGQVLMANGPGAVAQRHLAAVGLTAEVCDAAAVLELGQLQDAGLFPGRSVSGYRLAAVIARRNDRAFRMHDLWCAMADLLRGPAEQDGRLRLLSPDLNTGLHPQLIGTAGQAKKTFERVGFKGQNPIGNKYRGLSLKHAAYRLPGSGRLVQNAWWVAGDGEEIRRRLERCLGPFNQWTSG